MNSCILMAKIIRSPELRYTQETQLAVAQMLVEFAGSRPEDPPATLKVVGWGNLASEIKEKYSEGDWVILEGRLSMNTFERPEGFKEKRAELIVSRIYRLDGSIDHTLTSSTSSAGMTSSTSENVIPINSYQGKIQEVEPTDGATSAEFSSPELPPLSTVSSPEEQNLDDIPF
jgi:single-stranded DNA-binding protein